MTSATNSMAVVEELATQTTIAQTSVAQTETRTVLMTAMEADLVIKQTAAAQTALVQTLASSNSSILTPSGEVNPTFVPPGVRPKTYTLQNGEFPHCIARRFNVDPDALLHASGMTSPDLYYTGLTLTIPQSGAFPGSRMLATHPTTYTVSSRDETVYGIACKFGDVYPENIASANGISISAKLTAGQKLQIP